MKQNKEEKSVAKKFIGNSGWMIGQQLYNMILLCISLHFHRRFSIWCVAELLSIALDENIIP